MSHIALGILFYGVCVLIKIPITFRNLSLASNISGILQGWVRKRSKSLASSSQKPGHAQSCPRCKDGH